MKTETESFKKYRASLSGMSMKKLANELQRKKDELRDCSGKDKLQKRSKAETAEEATIKAEIAEITAEIRDRKGKAGAVENRQIRGGRIWETR